MYVTLMLTLHFVKYKTYLYFIWFDISVSDSYVADVEAYVLFYRSVVHCTKGFFKTLCM